MEMVSGPDEILFRFFFILKYVFFIKYTNLINNAIRWPPFFNPRWYYLDNEYKAFLNVFILTRPYVFRVVEGIL